ncbi:hypothetical protein IA57_06415 [Mangrovimonas yunxiaonensis]|uniref:NlpE C-terminal OB domain-containing protein n=1 Tax=Mangrovimonas yunxiaonensis TaxID=1197477 RepID=A0A084TL72_9FLAO|nr:hypothetical protein [Mangrovimonas yunxiaonensis]KFB01458.1 hypothetical protein IA57_06415 [Mangrovimonas yunxiaonensis]MBR9756972.1 hypothetical protein [Algicola sp.]GGH36547.1 hypothetical protein GCM10011364_03900 [Mangrovimonas yunxiaonensis]
MKKLVTVLLVFGLLSACKNDTKTTDSQQQTTNSEYTLLKGEFVYLADAAVLQTEIEVYGVVINHKMHELDDMVRKYKKEDTDMVPVEIKGLITPKPENEEGWPFRVEIKEIIGVSKPDPNKNDVVKLGSE